MKKETGVLALLSQVSAFLSRYFAVIIVVTSAIAFVQPEGFKWIPQYTALFLGTAMFGMGLTIKQEDFQIVFSRPKEIFSGCVLQYASGKNFFRSGKDDLEVLPLDGEAHAKHRRT